MKYLCLILTLMLCLLCLPNALAEDPVVVTATFYPMYLATINVTADVPGLSVHCLAPPSAGCLHDYQMTAEDRRMLADSDVIILNGAGLESFMDKLLPTLGGTIIDASEGIALLEGSHGPNPHVWVSTKLAKQQVLNIAQGLGAAMPQHADAFAQNAQSYGAKLDTLFDELSSTLTPYAGAPIITFHEAFDYFAADFDLNIVATMQTEHDMAPSARVIADLAVLARNENVRALFAEPQYDDTSVDTLSAETGIPVYLLDPVVSGTIDPKDLDAYLRIMRQNAATLVEALT